MDAISGDLAPHMYCNLQYDWDIFIREFRINFAAGLTRCLATSGNGGRAAVCTVKFCAFTSHRYSQHARMSCYNFTSTLKLPEWVII